MSLQRRHCSLPSFFFYFFFFKWQCVAARSSVQTDSQLFRRQGDTRRSHMSPACRHVTTSLLEATPLPRLWPIRPQCDPGLPFLLIHTLGSISIALSNGLKVKYYTSAASPQVLNIPRTSFVPELTLTAVTLAHCLWMPPHAFEWPDEFTEHSTWENLICVPAEKTT